MIQAGDFRQSNLITFTASGIERANASNPAPLFTNNAIPTDIPGYELSFVADPDYPGTTYMRASFVHGLGRIYDTSGPSFHGAFSRADLGDPKRPIDTSDQRLEMFTRSYIMIEEDFWTTTDGIKGGIGFGAQYGYWQEGNGGYWQPTTGNSGSPGTGLKINSARAGAIGLYEYQGHSMRMHFDLPRPSGTPYQHYRPVLMTVSHLPPFNYASPYGTEEIIRCGTVVMKKGRWHCVEWRIQMNTIDLSAPDALGNGVANHDGVMQLWVDGVLRWTESDFAWRRHPDMGIEGPWLVWVHGGTTPAAVGEIMHYRHNNYCAATVYIGPRS